MYRHRIVLAFGLLLPAFLSAQQPGDLDIERLEIPQAQTDFTTPYFGVGGGFVGSFLFLNPAPLNTKLQQWGVGELSRPLFLAGGEAIATLGLIPNVRVGFFGAGGSKEIRHSAGADAERRAELRVSTTGLAVAYVFVPLRSLALLPTFAGGWGTIGVELAQAPSRTRWEEIPQEMGATFLHSLNASYLFLSPQLYFEYAPLPFLLLRLGGGYLFAFVGAWKQNSIADVEGVPPTLTPSGASAQFAIFVGLFN